MDRFKGIGSLPIVERLVSPEGGLSGEVQVKVRWRTLGEWGERLIEAIRGEGGECREGWRFREGAGGKVLVRVGE